MLNQQCHQYNFFTSLSQCCAVFVCITTECRGLTWSSTMGICPLLSTTPNVSSRASSDFASPNTFSFRAETARTVVDNLVRRLVTKDALRLRPCSLASSVLSYKRHQPLGLLQITMRKSCKTWALVVRLVPSRSRHRQARQLQSEGLARCERVAKLLTLRKASVYLSNGLALVQQHGGMSTCRKERGFP